MLKKLWGMKKDSYECVYICEEYWFLYDRKE